MKLFHTTVVTCLALSSAAQEIKTYEQAVPGSSVKFKMIAIPAGTFQIGSKSIMADNDESPQKNITLSAFWMGEHEVTFEEWDVFFKDTSLPQVKHFDGVTRATAQYIDLTWGMGRDPKHPSNSMSQQAATMYCKWLWTKTGIFYRLPTEAEWEYACRAGSAVSEASRLADIAIYKENSAAKFQLVKSKKPNAWGLYDMLGNLSEWTIDQYDPIYFQKIQPSDPMTSAAARYPRTARGGSFQDEAAALRCANRIASDPKWNQRDPQIPKSRWWLTDGMFIGFRIVRPALAPTKEEAEKFYGVWLK